MAAPTPSTRLVHAAFFASGAASLTCEVVWFKLFGLVIGNTTHSASTVVAVFFVGLGLGAILAGGLADRTERPLRLYGLLELALALSSAVTTLALASWGEWIGLFQPFMAVDGAGAILPRVALAFALLALPTIGMGATLPTLARYVVARREELGARIGTLYALNTLGAALGCLWVGFIGIAWLGVLGAGLLASAAYAGIGGVALVAARWETPVVLPPEAPVTGRVDADAAWLVAVFAANGFVAVGYEILWFRLLANATVNTVYVFALLLGIYLLGLVLGAFAASRFLARQPGDVLKAFARVQLGVALAGVVALAALGRTRTFLILLGGDALGISGLLSITVVAALILLPPSVLLGLGFPLASQLAATQLRGLGSRIGLIYGGNTVVGAMGSLCTGFLFIPLLGSQGAGALLTVLNLALFGALTWRFGSLRGDGLLRREAALTAVGLVAMHLWLGPTYLRHAMTLFEDAEILDYRETADGTFLIVRYLEDGTAYQQVIVNGTSYANNRPPGRHYMALLAHLPILLHDEPRDVVVICVGTGTTVGAASISDRVDRVMAVDLSREIFDIAPHFSPWNHDFHRNPRVRQVVADGRHFLLTSPDTFDVLTFEPPPPLEAGVANLYSVEFYELARQRARPGALVVQWIPFQQGFLGLQKQLVRAALDSFPHVSLWLADHQQGILVASDRPLALDPAAIAARMAEPDVARELREIGVDAVEDLLALFVLADDDLRAWVGEGPSVTDDRPSVERFLGAPNDPFATEPLLAARSPISRVVSGPIDEARLTESRARTALLWRAADLSIAADFEGAATVMAEAVGRDPDNPYYAYRLREFERLGRTTARPPAR